MKLLTLNGYRTFAHCLIIRERITNGNISCLQTRFHETRWRILKILPKKFLQMQTNLVQMQAKTVRKFHLCSSFRFPALLQMCVALMVFFLLVGSAHFL
jgi:hypothetical protein